MSRGTSASAQQQPKYLGSVVLEEAYSNNLFQEPASQRRGGFFTNLAGQADYHPRATYLPRSLSLLVNGRVNPHHSDLDFVEFGPLAGYRIQRMELFLSYLFTPRKLSFLSEDGAQGTFYAKHEVEAGVQRKFGTAKRLRAELLFDGEWARYREPSGERDSFFPAVKSRLRYLVAGGFAPQIGFAYGHREARRENYDRDQMDVSAGFDLALPYGSQLRFRFRRSWRNYTVGSPKEDGRRNSNFDREDDLDEFQSWLNLPVPAVSGLTVGLRHRYGDGVLDMPNHKDPNGQLGQRQSFDVHEIGIVAGYSF